MVFQSNVLWCLQLQTILSVLPLCFVRGWAPLGGVLLVSLYVYRGNILL